ncbi:tyrosine-type recombinase/integrase [Sinorhizobium meliloti SM11]|uniref:XerD n=2 Tax=Rhizobium meliloti TaxID=382 RepID=Q1WLK7_SINMM|nr:tyrosine-type recombinase/integrase [Sinorhizobium meliloti]ABA55993.1 XerD [Sinorhizobium meliloti]MDE4561661.1 tyrosine-type recombinase/integrase [Sinorhizobium meliloti SM11]
MSYIELRGTFRWLRRQWQKAMCGLVRAFLRYLHLKGLISGALADRVRATCYSKLPTFLPPQKVQQVLDACDRTTALGLPDYAVLMILAKLGLRASEAAALNLDDVEAVMHDRLHGKGRRQAMTLLRPRRRNSNRRLYPAWAASFSVPSAISADACGARGFGSGCAITVMAKQALERVVSDGAHHGAHLFSHSLAPDLLLSGASFAAIGQLLCHSSTDCTRIADSDEAAPLFRDDCAPGFRDDLAPCLVGSAGDDCCQFIQARCQALRGRFRRRLSPLNSMRWALWTNLSSMASA